MTILRNREGQNLKVLSDTICIKLKSMQSPNQMAVVTVDVPPGGFVPPHTHNQEEESYYVLEGSMVMKIGNEEFEIESGDFVHIPPNTVHGYQNNSDRALRFLAWTVGGAIDEFFIEMDREIREIPDDLSKLPAIIERYGIAMTEPAPPAIPG
ncbi:cupin domain-containing protein [Oscillatoria sp. FACHB-1406]|uniref:cupin domain-containing protein n=1 Tax=Oscillatoria sp. FACHB-1406 TaxID=2692846 RepID=UPI0016875AF4|nr:cupin domain-containing protein [Oscillatoria sp. FACHB-1406]MBD2578471.1 cupin domain-containing protein [Oscillatoria sp. FACHB-1406]